MHYVSTLKINNKLLGPTLRNYDTFIQYQHTLLLSNIPTRCVCHVCDIIAGSVSCIHLRLPSATIPHHWHAIVFLLVRLLNALLMIPIFVKTNFKNSISCRAVTFSCKVSHALHGYIIGYFSTISTNSHHYLSKVLLRVYSSSVFENF